MSLGIYKPNQGYWVRVMTAIGAGMLVLATAAWAWQQALLVPLPRPTWSVAVSGVEGQVDAGAPIDLVIDDGVNEPRTIGSATVKAYTPGSQRQASLEIGDIRAPQGGEKPVSGEIGEGTIVRGENFSGDVTRGGVNGIPVFDPAYLQAGFVGAVLLFGAVFIYWLVGVKRNTSEFLIATDNEMKKVNWSTRREIIGSTWVVVAATFLIAALLFGVDQLFARFFQAINVLER